MSPDKILHHKGFFPTGNIPIWLLQFLILYFFLYYLLIFSGAVMLFTKGGTLLKDKNDEKWSQTQLIETWGNCKHRILYVS